MAAEIACYTEAHGGDGMYHTAVPGLIFAQVSQPQQFVGSIAEPVLAIVIQGRKDMVVGDETYVSRPGSHLVITVDLPVAGYIDDVSPEKPHLGIKIALDRPLLCELLPGVETGEVVGSHRGIALSPGDPRLLDAVSRLMRLLETPRDIPALSPLILREIHYLLLIGDQAPTVRQIATGGSATRRIAEVIRLLRNDFARPVTVNELARQANMSASAFHQHFKQVTSLSPLQYQKQLRLVEARRLMLSDGIRVERAAFAVGYESPSQFSREYGRLFGAPPLSDISRLRRSEGLPAGAA